MHSPAQALPKREPLDLSKCFVRDPSYWVVLFPDCHQPVVTDTEPPKGWGKVLSTTHAQSRAMHICDLWIEQRDRRHQKLVNALYTAAGACLLLAVMVAIG